MTPLSLVIVAPDGLSRCLPLRQLADQESCRDIEIVVADASHEEQSADGIRNLRHLRMPGAGIFTLRRAAIAAASHEWIVLTEDHCNLMPGFFASYREAIRNRPAAELISGRLINDSEPTVSSMANFLFTNLEHRPECQSGPPHPSIANLAVRRSAIRDAILAHDGAFEFVALAELERSGRSAHCPGAAVDHVRNGTLPEFCQVNFRNGRSAWACWRRLRHESTGAMLRRLARHCVTLALIRPVVVVRSLGGARLRSWAMAPFLFLFGFSHAAGAVLGMLADSGGTDSKTA